MLSNSILFEENNIKIYCDMDGVLTDFEKMAKKLDSKIFTYSEKDLWKMISNAGNKFWRDMDWTEDGKKLWSFIKKFNPKILTALPGISKDDPLKKYSKEGKTQWIERELGKEFLDNVIFTTSKEKKKFSNKNSILIDDRDKLIKEWSKNGGIGILYKSADSTIKEIKEIISN